MKRIVLLIGFCLIFTSQADAQSFLNKLGKSIKETVENTVERNVVEKTEEVTEKALDVKANKKNGESTDDEESENESQDNSVQNTKQEPQQKLSSTSRYDFVPGDQILYFEDFSQDAIGDFPALWTSNGSGEIKTVNIAPGNWFHLNGEDAVYCYMEEIDFPENFIVEFDIIPDEEFGYGIQFTLYQEREDDPKELNNDLYPGQAGLHLVLRHERWESKGYKDGEDWIEGSASKNPVIREKLNHVILWIQKRRVRVYHQNEKVMDMPTNIYPGVEFNRIRFSGWDRHSEPFISNIKITTASPDTRSKLITEGKLVTYGITFDVNKSDVKPESYGTLKSIADVLKENGSVTVKIIGHTDSDGDDNMNIDLSKRRAESVKNELINIFGIDAARLETEGAGETKPIAPNDTPANKAQNRRVEFIKTN